MGRKKTIVIIAIIAIIILMLAGVAFAFIYFNSDIFTSPKIAFYKNLSKNAEVLKGFSTSLLNIFEIEDVYVSKTNAKINLKGDDLKQYNDFSLQFNAQVNNMNLTKAQTIELRYNEDKIFEVEYLRNGDLHAIGASEILYGHIGVENNNLKSVVEKLEIADPESIPDKIPELENIAITQEKANLIFNNYKDVIMKSIPNECYSFNKKDSAEYNGRSVPAESYKVSLTDKQLYNILDKILEKAKDDYIILNMFSLNQNDIEILRNSFREEAGYVYNEEAMQIIVYIVNDKVIRTELVIIDNVLQNNTVINLSITNDNEIHVTVNRRHSEEKLDLKITKQEAPYEKNLQVNGNYTKKDNTQTFDIIYNKTIKDTGKKEEFTIQSDAIGALNIVKETFTRSSDLQIKQVDPNKCIIINNYTKEAFDVLSRTISEKAEKILKQKLQDINIGLPVGDENLLAEARDAANQVQAEQENRDTISAYIEEQNKKIFNEQFEEYVGEKKGTDVRTLLSRVSTHNVIYKENELKMIGVTLTTQTKSFPIEGKLITPEVIEALKKEVKTSETYAVEMVYNQEGYTSNIKITIKL